MGGDIITADTDNGLGLLVIFTAKVEETEASLISVREPRGRVLGLLPGQPRANAHKLGESL